MNGVQRENFSFRAQSVVIHIDDVPVVERPKTKEINRVMALKSKLKLFCCECKTVQLILDLFSNGEYALQCGHRRK